MSARNLAPISWTLAHRGSPTRALHSPTTVRSTLAVLAVFVAATLVGFCTLDEGQLLGPGPAAFLTGAETGPCPCETPAIIDGSVAVSKPDLKFLALASAVLGQPGGIVYGEVPSWLQAARDRGRPPAAQPPPPATPLLC